MAKPEADEVSEALDFSKYPIRRCRTLHFCELCRKSISFDESYHDGGYGRRAHKNCVDDLGKVISKHKMIGAALQIFDQGFGQDPL